MRKRLFVPRDVSREAARRRCDEAMRGQYRHVRFVASGKHDGDFRWLDYDVDAPIPGVVVITEERAALERLLARRERERAREPSIEEQLAALM